MAQKQFSFKGHYVARARQRFFCVHELDAIFPTGRRAGNFDFRTFGVVLLRAFVIFTLAACRMHITFHYPPDESFCPFLIVLIMLMWKSRSYTAAESVCGVTFPREKIVLYVCVLSLYHIITITTLLYTQQYAHELSIHNVMGLLKGA